MRVYFQSLKHITIRYPFSSSQIHSISHSFPGQELVLLRLLLPSHHHQPNPAHHQSRTTPHRISGITSVKLYMTYDAMKLQDLQILSVMIATRALEMTTMMHAENSDMISLITQSLLSQKKSDPYYHAIARPKISEDEATYRAISMSQLIEAPILLVHISLAVAAKHIRDAQTKMLSIHAETCPQYLYLMSDSLKGENFEGAKHVYEPPLRDRTEDIDAFGEQSLMEHLRLSVLIMRHFRLIIRRGNSWVLRMVLLGLQISQKGYRGLRLGYLYCSKEYSRGGSQYRNSWS